MRLAKFKRFLAEHGIVLEVGTGKHPYKAKKDGCRTYPIPAHKGEKTVVDDKYLRACCRTFGLDPNAWKDWEG
jgi:hypothetical protein